VSATPHSNAPISAGDLVVIVRTPQSHACVDLGRIFKVAKVRQNTSNVELGRVYRTRCQTCGFSRLASTTRTVTVTEDAAGTVVGLWRLKRIPPLSELEGVKTDEPIEEPA
jgi:hypothetical protein